MIARTSAMSKSAAATIVLLLLGLAGWTGPAAAQQPSPTQVNAIRSACRGDFQAHCAGVQPGGSAALACLKKNVAGLSPACQKAVTAVGGASAPAAEPPAAATAAAAPPAGRTACRAAAQSAVRAACKAGGSAARGARTPAPGMRPGLPGQLRRRPPRRRAGDRVPRRQRSRAVAALPARASDGQAEPVKSGWRSSSRCRGRRLRRIERERRQSILFAGALRILKSPGRSHPRSNACCRRSPRAAFARLRVRRHRG